MKQVSFVRRIAPAGMLAGLLAAFPGTGRAGDGESAVEPDPLSWVLEDTAARIAVEIDAIVEREHLDLAARLDAEVSARIDELEGLLQAERRRTRELEAKVAELERKAAERASEAESAPEAGAFLGIDYRPDPGVEILYVHPESPADLAGLLPGDRLTSIDGKEVDVENLAAIVREQSPAAVVELSWLRGENLFETMVRLTDRTVYQTSRSELAVHPAPPPASDGTIAKESVTTEETEPSKPETDRRAEAGSDGIQAAARAEGARDAERAPSFEPRASAPIADDAVSRVLALIEASPRNALRLLSPEVGKKIGEKLDPIGRLIHEFFPMVLGPRPEPSLPLERADDPPQD